MDNSIKQLTDRDALWRAELRDAIPAKERTVLPRTHMNELAPDYRITCNEEVAQGLTPAQIGRAHV